MVQILAIKAAKSYLDQAGSLAGNWPFQKPFPGANGHQEFFTLSYNVLNLLQVMRIPMRGRVLEVGSGPGWLTEILVGLGYEVYALDPCEAMHAIARRRMAGFRGGVRVGGQGFHLPGPSNGR